MARGSTGFTSTGATINKMLTLTVSSAPTVLDSKSNTLFRVVGSGSTAYTLQLPNASTLIEGIHYIFANRSNVVVNVVYNDTTLAKAVRSNTSSELRLVDNNTSNGDWDITIIGDSSIGDPEESYDDGLFTDFTPSTPVGTAVDRFNEVLKELSPKPAPNLSNIGASATGATSYLSWGASHTISGYAVVDGTAGNPAVDMNGLYSVSGTRLGAFTSVAHSGNIANSVTADPNNSYPAKAFGNGDQGTLNLYVNGSLIHSVNLATFASGNSLNGNGSGFNLSAATSVQFQNGNPFPLFKYRTGTWTVSTTDQTTGYNYVRIIHTVGSNNYTTNYLEWVEDTEATALTASSGTLSSLTMSGLKYLSGVKYYTSGYALYGVTINNAYRNLYSTSGSAISYSGTSCTVPSRSLLPIGSPDYEASTMVVTNASATINVTRLLDASISVAVNCLHPLKSSLTGAQSQTISNILLDNVSTASTDLIEYFDAETIRIQSVSNSSVNNYANQSDITTGAWTSSNSLVGTFGYYDGLLYYNSGVRYPTRGANLGNFSGIVNGPTSNVDYSAASGNRYFYVRLRNNSGATRANFVLLLAGSSTSFVSLGTGVSGNNCTLEMKFPTGSIGTGTGWMDCYGDFATNQWNDGDGCRNATAGAGRATGVNWGITVGTKSIAANEYIILRFCASSSWTGELTQVTLTWS